MILGWISKITEWLGSLPAITVAILIVIIWALAGPLLHFSEGWQLFINTGTTITTFIMVFIIQNSQNRDSRAIQAKLDQLIENDDLADNNLVGLEAKSEKEIKAMQQEIINRANQGE